MKGPLRKKGQDEAAVLMLEGLNRNWCCSVTACEVYKSNISYIKSKSLVSHFGLPFSEIGGDTNPAPLGVVKKASQNVHQKLGVYKVTSTTLAFSALLRTVGHLSFIFKIQNPRKLDFFNGISQEFWKFFYVSCCACEFVYISIPSARATADFSKYFFYLKMAGNYELATLCHFCILLWFVCACSWPSPYMAFILWTCVLF